MKLIFLVTHIVELDDISHYPDEIKTIQDVATYESNMIKNEQITLEDVLALEGETITNVIGVM